MPEQLVLVVDSHQYDVVHRRCAGEGRYTQAADVVNAGVLVAGQQCAWCHGTLRAAPEPHAFTHHPKDAATCGICGFTRAAGNHVPPPAPWQCPGCRAQNPGCPAGWATCIGCGQQAQING